MTQKIKKHKLNDFNLSFSCDNSKDNVGEKIENVNVKYGIKTKHYLNNISSVLEPNRVEILAQLMEENIGEIIAITGFQTVVNDVLTEYVVFCSAAYHLYYYKLNSQSPELNIFNAVTLTSKPKFQTVIEDGNNILLISTATDNLWAWDGDDEPIEILDSPQISSMAVGLNRLFVTDKTIPYSVAYSENYNPTTWALSSGDVKRIDFSDDMGTVESVVALDNYIFVFRQFGIIKIYGGKDDDNFSISKMYFAGGKINTQSICQVNDCIVFASSSGLYKFDGLNAKKIHGELDDRVDYDNCYAVSNNGIYYLFVGIDTTNQIYFVDLSAESIYETIKVHEITMGFAINISSINCIGFVGKITQNSANNAQIIAKTYTNSQNQGHCLYNTKFIDLNLPAKNKTIKRLFLTALTNANITLVTDKTTRMFFAQASDKTQSISINEICEKFSLQFESESSMQIEDVIVEYSYLEN